MPFALLIVGIVLVVSAVRGTTDNLTTLVKGDFTGQDNFIYWFVSILIIGALGYIDALKGLSRMFLALVIVVLFLRNGGFFQQAQSALGGSSSDLGNLGSLGNLSGDGSTPLVPNPIGPVIGGIEQPIAPARPM